MKGSGIWVHIALDNEPLATPKGAIEPAMRTIRPTDALEMPMGQAFICENQVFPVRRHGDAR